MYPQLHLSTLSQAAHRTFANKKGSWPSRPFNPSTIVDITPAANPLNKTPTKGACPIGGSACEPGDLGKIDLTFIFRLITILILLTCLFKLGIKFAILIYFIYFMPEISQLNKIIPTRRIIIFIIIFCYLTIGATMAENMDISPSNNKKQNNRIQDFPTPSPDMLTQIDYDITSPNQPGTPMGVQEQEITPVANPSHNANNIQPNDGKNQENRDDLQGLQLEPSGKNAKKPGKPTKKKQRPLNLSTSLVNVSQYQSLSVGQIRNQFNLNNTLNRSGDPRRTSNNQNKSQSLVLNIPSNQNRIVFQRNSAPINNNNNNNQNNSRIVINSNQNNLNTNNQNNSRIFIIIIGVL